MNNAYRQMLTEEGFSPEEIDYLEEYRETLPSGNEYGDFDMDDVMQGIVMGDRRAADKLITMYMGRVMEEAIEQREEGLLVSDLISEGNLALAECVYGFCAEPERIPRDVDSFLSDAIWDAMHKYAADYKSEAIEEYAVVEKANALLDSIDKLTRELGTRPNIDELANDMKISQQEVVEILKIMGEEVDEPESPEKSETAEPAAGDNYRGKMPEF